MEGGGMRGLYTAGVIDVLMENDIYADSAVGVSIQYAVRAKDGVARTILLQCSTSGGVARNTCRQYIVLIS